MKNPWEEIPLSDYENHMQLNSVMQLQAMNEMMKGQFLSLIHIFPVLKWTENFARQDRGGGILLKSKVAVVECREYRQELVDEAVRKVVGLLGGWERFVGKEERILLKPNLLAKCPPEKACTTHPQVFAAAGRALRKEGYPHLFFGDSPGNHLIGVEQTAQGCGILPEARSLEIPTADFSEGEKVDFPEAVSYTHLSFNGILIWI